ncbi:MAG TPA: hypothetical protein VFK13_00565 [Gemmatimonadaceae bacterium]|nr:hypothetical protein [Gemmatimonadaceae bacterium]
MAGASAIVRALIGMPAAVPDALLERFPELRAVRWRRGGLPPRVAGWTLGQRSVAAITLWRTVFLAPDVVPHPLLLLHEARHVQQFEASVTFPVRYLWESVRRGYHRNPYEADARAFAASRWRSAATTDSR